MTQEFGPSPIRNLAVTPIPGGFGQGFPGLVYLSTLAYLNPGQLPPRLRERSEETFYSELLETHEVAHQWWGNLVVPASYHDDWLIESLANYSALLLLEQGKASKPWIPCSKTIERIFSQRPKRTHTRIRRPDHMGLPPGIVARAQRLAHRHLRKGHLDHSHAAPPLGDEKFLALLREVSSHHHSISTDEFRELASRYRAQIARSRPENILRQLGIWNRRTYGEARLFLAGRETFREPGAAGCG